MQISRKQEQGCGEGGRERKERGRDSSRAGTSPQEKESSADRVMRKCTDRYTETQLKQERQQAQNRRQEKKVTEQ